MNSDTILFNNAVKLFFDYWEADSKKECLGAIGCNLININGKITHSFGSFPVYKQLKKILFLNLINSFVKPVIKHIKKRPVELKKYQGDVEYITGADLFLRNDSNAKFDEDFFMYYEETNMQYKLFLEKKKRQIIDGPLIMHLEGASSEKNKSERGYDFTKFKSKEMWYSACLYLKKNDLNKNHYRKLIKLIIFIWSLPWNRENCSEYVERIKAL